MLHHGLLLGDAPPAAVFSDHDTLLELLFEQCRKILRTLWTTCGIAGLAFLEARMLRRFPVAHLIIRILDYRASCSPALASTSLKDLPLEARRACSPV